MPPIEKEKSLQTQICDGLGAAFETMSADLDEPELSIAISEVEDALRKMNELYEKLFE